MRAAAAQKIIELAKAGERNPERLCEGVLKEFGLATGIDGSGVCTRPYARPASAGGSLADHPVALLRHHVTRATTRPPARHAHTLRRGV
jgi:hypothetical protein